MNFYRFSFHLTSYVLIDKVTIFTVYIYKVKQFIHRSPNLSLVVAIKAINRLLQTNERPFPYLNLMALWCNLG